MTVPVIVEIIFRFIPSALLVFGFIEINLTAKYNKYIQFIAINTVYLFAGLFGQYMREQYKLEFFDFVLAVALVLIYSIFFHASQSEIHPSHKSSICTPWYFYSYIN